jgi:hypothetical protein
MPAPVELLEHRESASASTSRLTKGFADLIQTLMRHFDSYRPELHYMRGAGPKWHAKNDLPSASPGSTRTSTSTIGVLASLLRPLKCALTFHVRFTGFALLHHQPDPRLAEARFHIWRQR